MRLVDNMKRDHFKQCENYKMHYREQLDGGLSEVRTAYLNSEMMYRMSTSGAGDTVSSVGFSIKKESKLNEGLQDIVPEKLLVERVIDIPPKGEKNETEVFECYKFRGNADSLNVEFKLIE